MYLKVHLRPLEDVGHTLLRQVTSPSWDRAGGWYLPGRRKPCSASAGLCPSLFPWLMPREQQQRNCSHVRSQTSSECVWDDNEMLTRLLPFSAPWSWEGAGEAAVCAAAETRVKQNCRDCSLQLGFLLWERQKSNFCLKVQMLSLMFSCMQR